MIYSLRLSFLASSFLPSLQLFLMKQQLQLTLPHPDNHINHSHNDNSYILDYPYTMITPSSSKPPYAQSYPSSASSSSFHPSHAAMTPSQSLSLPPGVLHASEEAIHRMFRPMHDTVNGATGDHPPGLILYITLLPVISYVVKCRR